MKKISNKKYSILLFFVILFYNDILGHNDFTVQNIKEQSQTDLRGLWSICAVSENGVMKVCNVCHKIVFRTDGVAKVIKPNGREMEIFNWKIQQDSLFFSFNDLQKTFFKYDVFHIRYIQKVKYFELELFNKEHNVSYILRK